MRLWKNLIAMLLLAIWLPVTSHCLLEVAGIIPTDECCESTELSLAHECSESCDSLEQGGFQVREHQDALVAPPLILAFVTVAVDDVVPSVPSVSVEEWALHEFSLPLFDAGTSLPVRGPSLIS